MVLAYFRKAAAETSTSAPLTVRISWAAAPIGSSVWVTPRIEAAGRPMPAMTRSAVRVSDHAA
jgi:hypothetical protein